MTDKPILYRGCIAMFPRALTEIAGLTALGNAKHDGPPGLGRKPVGVEGYRESLTRHLVQGAIHPLNEDDNVLHLAQVAWNALATLELTLAGEVGEA